VYETNTDEENIRLIREENDNAAFEYLITGEFMDAPRARELGLINRIAPPEDVAGTVADGQATFTWTNPDEQPGDRYIVDQVTNPELVPPTTTDEPTAQPGETCVEVSVWRSNGRESAPTRRCVKS